MVIGKSSSLQRSSQRGLWSRPQQYDRASYWTRVDPSFSDIDGAAMSIILRDAIKGSPNVPG